MLLHRMSSSRESLLVAGFELGLVARALQRLEHYEIHGCILDSGLYRRSGVSGL